MTHYVNENMSIGPKYDEFYSVIYLQPNRKTPADSVTDPLIAQLKTYLTQKQHGHTLITTGSPISHILKCVKLFSMLEHMIVTT